MRRFFGEAVASAVILVAAACGSTAPYAVPAAAINTTAALAASAQQVAAGGCIATCAYGTECNPRTGFCEPSRCGRCPFGERCVASAEGFRCTSGGVVPPPATLRTQPPVGAALVPGVGFTAQPGLPPPSPQERSDAHVK